MIPLPANIKLAGIALGAVLTFGGGFYCGLHWELPAVEKAQLALAGQQKADAEATAQANTVAAQNLIADAQTNEGALAAHQGRMASLKASLNAAPTAGAPALQDSGVAPVLSQALTQIAAQQGGGK